MDIPKIKKSDLVNQNLKFIFFNKTKIFEYLANYIFNKTPLLNFAETNNAQIVSGQFNIKTPSYSPLHTGFKFDNIIKNLSSGFLSFLFLLLIVSMFSNFDFLRIETSSNFNESNVVFEDIVLMNYLLAYSKLKRTLNLKSLNRKLITNKSKM